MDQYQLQSEKYMEKKKKQRLPLSEMEMQRSHEQSVFCELKINKDEAKLSHAVNLLSSESELEEVTQGKNKG